MRLVAMLLTAVLVAGVAPATASAITETRPLEVAEKFASALDADATAPTAAQKTGAADAAAQDQAAYTAPLAKAKAPLPKPKPLAKAPRTVRTTGTAARTSSSTPSGSSSAAKPTSSGDTLSRAQSILAARIAMYPILRGATVQVGDTKGNPQGICYYKSGRIIINPNHTVSLERIINHEIWHIIDWRDNGRIDWGESVPPGNAADFRG